MSRSGSDLSAAKRRHHAAVFAALADETRLSLVTTLSGGGPRSIAQLTRGSRNTPQARATPRPGGEPRSIAQLTGGSRMTRQAITKHLRVLESAGIVHSVRAGRES